MLKEILRKLHLSQTAYNVEKHFLRKRKPCFGSADEALRYLHSIKKDDGKSCVCQHDMKETDYDLEIIVPCYNVELYVEECLASILSQETAFSYCVTAVNDGSTDRTGEILKKYAHLENVNVITQRNRGLSGARNAGIGQARGRYLLFADSDDMLLPGAIEALMRLAAKTGADIVDSGHRYVADRKKGGFGNRVKASVYDFLQRPLRLAYDEHSPGVTGYPCGKVLKRELFHRVEFPEGYWFEDTVVWMILEPLCKTTATTDALTFKYRMNPDSISHTASGNVKSIDTLYVTLRLLEDRKALGIGFDQYQYDMLLQQMRNNYCRLSSLNRQTRQAAFVVESEIISTRFSEWDTNNPSVRPIQDFLRNKDYDSFDLWCRWH